MELAILQTIQSFKNPFLDVFFEFITILGEEVFLTLIFTALYWCINKKSGEYMGFAIFSSICANGLLKDTFKIQRPIGEIGIETIRPETATGYSFPSGHTQTSTTFYSSLYFTIKDTMQKKSLSISLMVVGIVMSLLVGFSRLYLGVHYPKDMLGGLIFGFSIAFVSYKLFTYFDKKDKLCLLYTLTTLFMLLMLFFATSEDYFKAVALLFGFTVSMAIEKKYIHFTTQISNKQKFLRWICGLVLMGGVMLLCDTLFPDTKLFDFIKYSGVSFTGIAIYPYLFTQFERKFITK